MTPLSHNITPNARNNLYSQRYLIYISIDITSPFEHLQYTPKYSFRSFVLVKREGG